MNIELTKNKKAVVSPEFEYLNQFKWHFDGRYARRTVPHGKRRIPLPVPKCGPFVQLRTVAGLLT
jgi:hypothetical protein